jgi:DNA repair protein SbcC/Rad50
LTALEKERERRATLEQQRQLTVEEIAAADDAGIEHGRAAASTRARAAEIAAELEGKKQDWMRRREALALVWTDSPLLARRQVAKIATLLGEVPPVRGGKKEIERAAAELMAHAETIRTLAEKDEHLTEALEAARTAQDELTRRSEAAAPRLEEIESKKAELSFALEEIRSDAKNASKARAEAEATLRQPLERRAGWEADLARDPAGMVATLTTEVSTWNANEARAVNQRQQIVELSQKTELHLAEADRARRDRAKGDALKAERLAKQIALERGRAVLLSGRSVEDVQQEIGERLREASARAHDAESRHALANQALAAAEERLEHASDLLREASSSVEEQRVRMDAALAASPFADLEELERSLQHERGWLEAQRTRIRALEEELTRKEAALADRQHRLEAHEEVKPSGEPEDLSSLELEHQRALEEIARLQEKSSADDTARRSLAALAPEIARQQQSLEQWSEMNALIGSADGKKFRTFAQGLTLDLLLDQANHHLAQLRPRYRLARVPGWDMELEVVDGDMGEEARPVGTLSGGETFLVSLALALGLSSLSSKNVKIESLFIDEGFGHLDRDSLDVALSTLDQLQAEGRTIALISHVPDIAERIGYQVRVEPRGPGRSEVRVVRCPDR